MFNESGKYRIGFIYEEIVYIYMTSVSPCFIQLY